MADPVSSTTGGSVLDRVDASRSRLADSEQTFLNLLTVQLKNQDPLSPLDSNQFTQQIVQMTGVEQQLIANDLLSMLVGMSDGGLAGAVGLIGKQVSALSDKATLQDGKATWSYELPRAAASVKVEVVNSLGQTVWSEDKTGVAGGTREVAWDGKNADGQQLSDGGQYTLRITAKGTADETIPTSTYVSGVASAIETIDGATMVTVGKSKVPLSSIVGVKTAA
jgi:flagellar basal-body rod modification protein FlgD